MRYPLVIGNWKLNGSQQFVEQLLGQLVAQLDCSVPCQVAVAPPAPYLALAKQQLATSQIAVAAQNCDLHQTGAYTGEIASAMLKDIGVSYVIIGHSERRQYHHETDAVIAEKFALIKQQQLIPVLCIGETAEQNSAGETQAVCARQIDAVIQHLGIAAFQGSVIAYEPIWAIGTGKSATPEQAQQTHAFIRAHLAQHDAEIAKQVIIQYGGSVTADNAAALFAQTDIDGALVGGASLKADNFIAIVKAAAASQSA